MGGISIQKLFCLLCTLQEACSILKGFGQPLTLGVCMVVEIEEKDQEYEPIQPNDVEEYWELVRAILHEKKLANVDGHHHKLNLKTKLKLVSAHREKLNFKSMSKFYRKPHVKHTMQYNRKT